MSSAVETSLILEMPARAQKTIQRFDSLSPAHSAFGLSVYVAASPASILDFARNDKICTVPLLPKLIDILFNSFTCDAVPGLSGSCRTYSRATNTNRTNFMAEKSIEEKVKDIIVEQLGVNPEQVTPQASFIEDLGADSLDIVELVMAFEEEFGVEVPDEDAEKLQTVGDVIKYIEEKSSKQQ